MHHDLISPSFHSSHSFAQVLRCGFACWLMLTLSAACFGSLVWENKTVEVQAEAGKPEAVGEFRFKNTGSTTVRLLEVRPSCDCTIAELSKREFAPDETGVIRTVFTIGDRMGMQEKMVNITTDDPTNPMITLILKVGIPDLLSYSSRMLHWQIGGQNAEQTVDITPLGENGLVALEVKSIAPDKQALVRTERLQDGMKYRLTLQPATLDQPRTIVVTMLAKFADGAQHSFTIFVLVR